MDKEGGFVNRPPILDGTNYDYWKARMVAFIKSMDDKAWKAVVKGWDPPMVIGLDGKVTDVIKAEEEWNDADEKSSEGTVLRSSTDKKLYYC